MATRPKSKHPKRPRTKKATLKRSPRKASVRARANGNAKVHSVARRQPETLRLRSLTPTFTVNDLEESISWYCEGLGCIVSERWEEGGKLQGVMLKAGSCSFGLSQDDFAKGRDREKGIGFRIYAETAQGVDELAERLRAFGGRIVREPNDEWGSRNFTVEDPDGFKITFSQSK